MRLPTIALISFVGFTPLSFGQNVVQPHAQIALQLGALQLGYAFP